VASKQASKQASKKESSMQSGDIRKQAACKHLIQKASSKLAIKESKQQFTKHASSKNASLITSTLLSMFVYQVAANVISIGFIDTSDVQSRFYVAPLKRTTKNS
jgi:hypothetical protein